MRNQRGAYIRKRLTVSEKLRVFIREEMDKRKMSARQFADLLSVATSTITTHLHEADQAQPTLDFLRKLAQGTKVPLAVIIAMAYPDVAGEISDISPDILLIATRLHKKDKTIRDIIMRLVNGD